MKYTLKLKRYWLWLILLAALAVGLCFMPLLNLLGYEFCLCLALAGSLAALHLGSVQVAAARGRDEGMAAPAGGGAAALLSLTGRALAANLLLLLPPLIIISLNALRVKNCDYLEGLYLFALLPSLSVAVATVTGVLWGALLPRPWQGTLAAILTLIGSVIWGLFRFYDAPAIFAYDPFIGFFPGAMYDETVSVSSTFLLYRLHNLAWTAGALLLAASLFRPLDLRIRFISRPRPVWPMLAGLPCLLLGLGLFLLSGEIGFAISAQDVAAELGGERRTPNFTIHYPAQMKKVDVDLLARDHEFRYAQLKRYLGVSPPRIRSFIFASVAQKRRLMGAGRTFIAKPWRREVYLQHMGFPHPVLKHELAHIFGGQFGDSIFGISMSLGPWPRILPRYNVGLIEGLAVAADWRDYGESTAHQYAAALQRLKLAPPLESLFGTGFLTHAAGRSYTLAGSFCRRLVELHGVEKFKRVFLSGGDFIGVYGRTLSALLKEWSSWLDEKVEVPAATLQLAKERFRRPSILRRVCGHEVANLRAEAGVLQGRNQHDGAIRLLKRVCSFEPGDPGHHFTLVHALVEARRLDEAMAGARRLLEHASLSKPLKREVLELMGDLTWWRGEGKGAGELYARADKLASVRGRRRLLSLKRWGLLRGGELARLVQRYINPAPDDPRDPGRDVYLAQRIDLLLNSSPTAGVSDSPMALPPLKIVPDDEALAARGLGLYLQAKQLANRRHCDLAAKPMARSLELGLPDNDFVIEARLTLARCHHRLGRLAPAAAVLSTLLKSELPGGMALMVRDWAQRVRWESGDPL